MVIIKDSSVLQSRNPTLRSIADSIRICTNENEFDVTEHILNYRLNGIEHSSRSCNSISFLAKILVSGVAGVTI